MSLRPQQRKLASSDAESASLRAGLTARECEIMHWISEGKRDREIAVILGISRRTVEKHVCHILEKLGVETRTAAANECHKSVAVNQTRLLHSASLVDRRFSASSKSQTLW